jgi:hypothetical protein
MGASSRSVLSHNGIITLGELLVLCPEAMSNKKTLALAVDQLLDLSKKNKPKVIRDRVDAILTVRLHTYNSLLVVLFVLCVGVCFCRIIVVINSLLVHSLFFSPHAQTNPLSFI